MQVSDHGSMEDNEEMPHLLSSETSDSAVAGLLSDDGDVMWASDEDQDTVRLGYNQLQHILNMLLSDV